MKDVTLHRVHLKNEMIELFQQEDILQYGLRVSLIDPRGRLEEGVGDGVTRDIFCWFFGEFLSSCTLGRQDKVPSIRHDMCKQQWCALARFLLHAIKVNYFPLSISPAFMLSALFGDDVMEMMLLLITYC